MQTKIRAVQPICCLLAILALSACKAEPKSTGQSLIKQNQQPSPTSAIQLTRVIPLSSKAFANLRPIPKRYSCQDENISPPLNWGKVPGNTRSVVLILDDPDAPGGTWLHWLVYNIPPEIIALPENLPKGETLSLGALQGLNDFKQVGYGGPCPPAGNAHHYHFRLFALDTMLQLEPGASRAQVEAGMKGHVLGEGELVATFKR